MLDTQDTTAGHTSPAGTTAERRTAGDLSARAAGWGALTFAVTVIAQNVITNSSIIHGLLHANARSRDCITSKVY